MRLAVVGSSNTHYEQRHVAYRIIRGFIVLDRPQIIISGGAVGIDTVAYQSAKSLGVPIKTYRPKNARWEPEGYKERNLLIAEDCTHLLCIRTSQSTTYGSGWTADRAEEMGKTVWRVTI